MNDRERQPDQFHPSFWFRLVLVLLLLLPFVILFITPVGRSWGIASAWFLLLLLFNFILLFWLWRAAFAVRQQLPKPRMILPDDQPDVVKEVMDVCVATIEDGVSIFRGPLKEPAASAFDKLKAAFPGQVPLLQQDERLETAIVVMAKPVEQATFEKPVHPAVHWSLFFITFITTTWAGAAYQQIDLLREPARFTAGLPYSIGLLAILGCHELGHYFAARFHNMNVTPPFFIPVPFALGTFGAFIKMRSPPEERTSLFDMAVAGPLAGLVIAVPALLIGLRHSTIVEGPMHTPMYWLFGNVPTSSLLFGFLTKLSLPEIGAGDMLKLSPLAFAGWLGLIITALNLLPIGQLDGGHVARAMFGTRGGETISRTAMWILLLLAIFVWQGLLLWAIIVFFIARRVTPPLNDLTPIPLGRRLIGYCSFFILALILIPFPQALWAKLNALV